MCTCDLSTAGKHNKKRFQRLAKRLLCGLHREAAEAGSIVPELNILLFLFRLKNIAVIILRIGLIRQKDEAWKRRYSMPTCRLEYVAQAVKKRATNS